MTLATKQINVHWGDPLQIWKWPAIAILAYWQSIYMLEPGEEWLVGGFLGSMVGLSIGVALATWVWRKIVGEGRGSYLQWWKWAIAATLASIISVPTLVSPTGIFFWAMAVLAGLFVAFTWASRKTGVVSPS